MMSRSLCLLLVFAALAYAAPAAEEENATPEIATERFANLSSLTLPGTGDLSFNASSLMNILVSGGAVVLGLIGLAAVIALVMPLFGFKFCSLLGSCPDSSANGAYLAGSGLANGVAQAYDTYHTYNQPSSAYAGSSNYQKRSLEYFGPILKALNAAYEKFESVAPLQTPVKKE